MTVLRAIATAMVVVLLAGSPAVAADPAGSGREVKIGAAGGGFDAAASAHRNEQSSTARLVANRASFTEERLVPTCAGNTTAAADNVSCQTAESACPDPAQVRVWVFRRTVTPGEPPPPFTQVLDPPYRCVAADEPALDPRVAIAALIEREFQRVVVLRGVAQTNPSPRTLVNVATLLETPTVERYDIPLQLLGQQVVITAQAQRWEWHTGDGAVVATDRGGTRGRVEHVYRSTGPKTPYVVITWTGTYTVNGQPMGAVPGSVTTRGEPGAVDVREARTQLVDD